MPKTMHLLVAHLRLEIRRNKCKLANRSRHALLFTHGGSTPALRNAICVTCLRNDAALLGPHPRVQIR